MISVTITCTSKKEAEMIAHQLLDRKLIACANLFPVHSLHLWKGKKEKSSEWVLWGKTIEKKYAALEKEVKKLHSYDVPFIGYVKEKTTPAIERWMREEL